ncbi:MAG: hypothetical protein ACREFD_06445 [Stellaceae bacterium]
MTGSDIDVAARDGGSFKAYLAKPAIGSGPGIVLLQEIFGIIADIRDEIRAFPFGPKSCRFGGGAPPAGKNDRR